MLVVYQSLESVGHKETTGHSVVSGNSFKHRAQTNAGKVYDLDNADRKLTFPVPHYDFATKKIVVKDMEVEFATGPESKAFSNTFKSGQDTNELLEFLSDTRRVCCRRRTSPLSRRARAAPLSSRGLLDRRAISDYDESIGRDFREKLWECQSVLRTTTLTPDEY